MSWWMAVPAVLQGLGSLYGKNEQIKALEKDVPKKYEETKKKISDQKGGTKGSGPKGGGGGAGSIGFLKLVTPPYKKFSKGGRVKKNVDGIAKKGKTKGRMI